MRLGLFVVLLAITVTLPAQDLLPRFNADKDGLWLEGHDPVAYFNLHHAVKGSREYSAMHQGATFRFISAAHRDLFIKEPQRFLPQYGGWCAYAMGDSGKKVEVDPATFRIKDGKLFLFYNAYFNNTLTRWNKDERRLLPAADGNWAKQKHKS